MVLSLLRLNEPAAVATTARDPAARILGGGTLLVRHVNMGDVTIERYLRFDHDEVRTIAVAGTGVTLGARVTMAAILEHPALGVISAAAKTIGSPAVREMATVGGNLHAPSPYGDLATLLLAMNATVTLHDGVGKQDIAIADFIAERDARWRTALITVVTCDLAAPDERILFRKISRSGGKGAAMMTIAVRMSLAGDRIERARIALGAVCDRPVRAVAAEAALVGATLSPEGLAPALGAVVQGIALHDDALTSAWYRREVLPVHLGRLLLDARPVAP